MVDIIVGSVPPINPSAGKPKPPGAPVEAEILHVRDPRRTVSGPQGEERRRTYRQDPVNGRVLTLLVPNGMVLPKDLAAGKYKVMLRFMKK